MSERFERDKPIGKALAEWWQGLENDRASRAILRRAAGPTEVALSAPYQRLYRRLQLQGWNPDSKAYLDDRLAANP
jgi:CRISPR system Cascade subunit CasB